MIEITVNHEKRQVQENTTLADLVGGYLAEHHVPPEMVNLALNGAIILRPEWPDHRLAKGDAVEYLWFMGGGARKPGWRRLAGLAVALVLALNGVAWAKPAPVEFTLASCCVTEEVMRNAIIPGFVSYWKNKTGQDVTVNATFAGSGTLKNQILGGAPVQVAVFSSELYPDLLKGAGLITSDWHDLPHQGVAARSVIVMMAREKNPKHFQSFADLEKPGVSVIHSSPATSGGAQWAIYAVYGSALKESEARGAKADVAEAQKLLAGVEKNVIAMPESAAQAMAQFKAGYGDVLLTYENEILYELGKGEKYAMIVPKSTVTTEWVATRIDRNIKPDQREVVDAFLAYLSTEPTQKAFAKYGFRSTIPAVNRAERAKYADVELPFGVGYLGGARQARKEIIDGYWQSLSRR